MCAKTSRKWKASFIVDKLQTDGAITNRSLLLRISLWFPRHHLILLQFTAQRLISPFVLGGIFFVLISRFLGISVVWKSTPPIPSADTDTAWSADISFEVAPDVEAADVVFDRQPIVSIRNIQGITIGTGSPL